MQCMTISGFQELSASAPTLYNQRSYTGEDWDYCAQHIGDHWFSGANYIQSHLLYILGNYFQQYLFVQPSAWVKFLSTSGKSNYSQLWNWAPCWLSADSVDPLACLYSIVRSSFVTYYLSAADFPTNTIFEAKNKPSQHKSSLYDSVEDNRPVTCGYNFIQAIAIGGTLINEKCLKEKEGGLNFIEASKQGSHPQVLWE